MINDMRPLSIPLPEDIDKAKWCGDFSRAQRLIAQRMENPNTPACVKERLSIEKTILRNLPKDYIYSEQEGLELIRKDISDFTWEEFSALMDSSAIDWIYIDGKPHLSRRFYETLLKVYPHIAERAGFVDEDSADEKELLNDSIASMRQNGSSTWHFKMKASLKIADKAFRPGETVQVHIPIPTDAINMKNIRILATYPEASFISPDNSPQRTVYFQCSPTENIPFTVEYEYDSHVDYFTLNESKVAAEQPHFDTQEQYPHVRFTPFIKSLCNELKGTQTNPLQIARSFYDYCTKAVTYSFMREYFTITSISEYAGLNQKGDCGVQALLFITLCRCAGIPARWQSGLFVTPYSQGCHDWAQFFLAPYGWLFADPSFGGSAYRAGNLQRHDYYFGNLDPFRMAANSQFQASLQPEKTQLRSDPYDNQRGEAEYEGYGLAWDEFDVQWELLESKKLS